MAKELFGQAIAKPPSGAAHDLDVLAFETDLFPELAEHGRLRGLVAPHPPLRELPGVPTGAPRPQDLAVPVAQDDADIQAESLRVYHDPPPAKATGRDRRLSTKRASTANSELE